MNNRPQPSVVTNRAGMVASFLCLGASFLILYRDVLASLVHDWSVDDNYSHGFLIVPIALYLVWQRRDKLAEAPSRPSYLGLAVIAGGLGLLLVGTLSSELFLTRISMLGIIAGTVLFIFGPIHLGLLTFPILFLLLMIPVPTILLNQIAFPLQLLASRFGEGVLTVLNVPVLREGNVIHLATTSLEVAEACSGIRSLVALLALAIVFGYFADPRTWVRMSLALAAFPIAIAANGIRVAGTGVSAHYWGAQAAEGFFHSFSGWIVFLAAFAMLLVLERLVHVVSPAPEPPAARSPGEAS